MPGESIKVAQTNQCNQTAEEEQSMTSSLRKNIVLIAMIIALLSGLLNRPVMVISSPMIHNSNPHHGHVLYYVCPPPPFDCR